MFYVAVDGHQLPLPLSGHPALELCNTWAGWNSLTGSGGDYLTDHATLVAWARHHELLTEEEGRLALATAAEDPSRGARVLSDTRKLRGRLYALLVDPDERLPGRSYDETLTAVSTVAAEAQGARHLVRAEDGAPTWRFGTRHPPTRAARLPLLAAAAAAADLLTSPQRTVVRACPGVDCGWLFLDPHGRRKWCSMAVCGNRAKARAHAERRRG